MKPIIEMHIAQLLYLADAIREGWFEIPGRTRARGTRPLSGRGARIGHYHTSSREGTSPE